MRQGLSNRLELSLASCAKPIVPLDPTSEDAPSYVQTVAPNGPDALRARVAKYILVLDVCHVKILDRKNIALHNLDFSRRQFYGCPAKHGFPALRAPHTVKLINGCKANAQRVRAITLI
jgi:hypothetical protein